EPVRRSLEPVHRRAPRARGGEGDGTAPLPVRDRRAVWFSRARWVVRLWRDQAVGGATTGVDGGARGDFCWEFPGDSRSQWAGIGTAHRLERRLPCYAHTRMGMVQCDRHGSSFIQFASPAIARAVRAIEPMSQAELACIRFTRVDDEEYPPCR